MAVFKDIKSGKLYRKLSDKFMFKENGIWKKALVLYEALYQNPDIQHFSRTKEDFEECIYYVVEKYQDVDVPIEHSALFSLHNFLTGSCLFGRKEFAKAHFLDPEHGAMTMRVYSSNQVCLWRRQYSSTGRRINDKAIELHD